MESIINFLKGILNFTFNMLLLCFISGYLIGNYYATRAAVEDEKLVTPHNIVSWFILSINKTPGIEEYTFKDYNK